MPSKDRNEGADSGVAMSAGNANQDLQPIRFGSAESEAQVRGLLSKVDTMRVRVSLADEQDVEGHLFSGGDQTLVLALQVADDDVEGHAISIHFPDAEQARRFRNELLAAGVLTATLAMGVGTGVALAPHQTGTAAAPASQATVFMDTSAQAREGGALTQSRTLSIPVGSASDVAQKAQAAESGLTGPALKSAVGSQSKGAAAVNPAAAADAARTQAGITGSLAGTPTVDTSTKAREGGALSESIVNPAAAADAARTQAGITGSLAGSTSAAEKPAIPQGSAPVPAAQQISDEIAAARGAAQAGAAASASIPQGAPALSAADQINAEIAAARGAAEAGAAASASIPQGAPALSAADQINAEIAAARAAATPAADAQTQAREGGALGETGVNPMAAADAARTQAGITGSLAGTPTGDASTKAREGGALSEQSATSSPKVDYSGKPLPPEPTSSSPTSPGVDYTGKPLPPVDKG